MSGMHNGRRHSWAAHFFVVQLGPSLVLLALLPTLHTTCCYSKLHQGLTTVPPVQAKCPACLIQNVLPWDAAETASASEPIQHHTSQPPWNPGVAIFSAAITLPPAHGPPSA